MAPKKSQQRITKQKESSSLAKNAVKGSSAPDDFSVFQESGDINKEDTEPQFGATASSQIVISKSQPILDQQYHFQFLRSMTDFETKPIEKEAIERDFLAGTKKLLDSSFELDEQLNRFFLEKCIFAYNSDIVGQDQIRAFVADCWKVFVIEKFLYVDLSYS
jgi:hypothetical protein